ncbi:hypothetical protein GALL_551330 [mine drainage metagenome]|uniref:Uncharacterized protein n=1 Tax=mine drainage metagenome TaxID=410659 RepID=A0A1J5NX41_9ZZZZ
MDDQAKTPAAGHRRPLQHFEIAVRIAKCGDRPASDMFVDAYRLAGAVIDETDLGQTEQ